MGRRPKRNSVICTVASILCYFSVTICQGAEPQPDWRQLPLDVPQTAEVIHHLKYPFVRTFGLSLRLGQLYGDKFLSTQVLVLEGRYFFTESLGAFLSGAVYRQSIDADAYSLANLGAPPSMYNPSYALQAGVVICPIYGKLALGSYIQRLRLGLLIGAHAAEEKSVMLSNSNTLFFDRVMIGPTLGLDLDLPISKRLSIGARLEWMAHGKLSPSESDGFRQLWQITLGVETRI